MSKAAMIRLAGTLVAAGSLWFGLTQQDLTIEKVKDDLHVISGGGGNVAALATAEGVILIDDKFEKNIADVLAKVKTVTDKPVRYVLSTHHHGDHTGGNTKLIGSTEIFAHTNARANMLKGSQPAPPRITFSDELALHLGGRDVRAKYFGRGHTNGDVVILFPAERVAHFGDLFISGAPFIDYANGGSGVEWIATVEQALKQLDFDIAIPGHGPVMKRADVVTWKNSFETVRNRLSELRRQGKTREQAAEMFKVETLPGWTSAGMWVQRSYPGFWDELGR